MLAKCDAAVASRNVPAMAVNAPYLSQDTCVIYWLQLQGTGIATCCVNWLWAIMSGSAFPIPPIPLYMTPRPIDAGWVRRRQSASGSQLTGGNHARRQLSDSAETWSHYTPALLMRDPFVAGNPQVVRN